MFYCEPCRRKWKWPMPWTGLFAARINCEMCDKRSDCYDVPSRYLPDPIGVLTEQEVIDGAA